MIHPKEDRFISHQESELSTYSVAFLFTYSILSSSPQDFSYSRYFLNRSCKSMQIDKCLVSSPYLKTATNRNQYSTTIQLTFIFLGGRLKHIALSNNARIISASARRISCPNRKFSVRLWHNSINRKIGYWEDHDFT